MVLGRGISHSLTIKLDDVDYRRLVRLARRDRRSMVQEIAHALSFLELAGGGLGARAGGAIGSSAIDVLDSDLSNENGGNEHDEG